MAQFLEMVLIVVSVLMIVIVLMQSDKASDASQIITGGNDALFMERKERGFELFMSRLTLALGILFFLISFVLFVM